MNSFPCVVFDNECTGKSEGDPVKLTFTTWVENTIGVIDRLTEGPVVLVGTCLGGWLSLIAAQRIPERLHGLGRRLSFSSDPMVILRSPCDQSCSLRPSTT